MFMGFHGGSDGKESTCSAGDLDSIAGLGRSLGGGHGKSLQYSSLEHLHGQRCLVGYSPRDHRVRHSGAIKHSWVASYVSLVSLLSLPSYIPVAEMFWGLVGLMQVIWSPQGLACSKPFIILSVICYLLLNTSKYMVY